jgi:hypothetical protein
MGGPGQDPQKGSQKGVKKGQKGLFWGVLAHFGPTSGRPFSAVVRKVRLKADLLGTRP